MTKLFFNVVLMNTKHSAVKQSKQRFTHLFLKITGLELGNSLSSLYSLVLKASWFILPKLKKKQQQHTHTKSKTHQDQQKYDCWIPYWFAEIAKPITLAHLFVENSFKYCLPFKQENNATYWLIFFCKAYASANAILFESTWVFRRWIAGHQNP